MSKKNNYKPKKPEKKKAKEVDPFFAVIAKVYGVPVSGIDAIEGQPYLNKDGRLYLLGELRTGKQAVRAMRAELIRTSTSLIEPSIVKKTIIFRDDIEFEAIGEASQDSVANASVKKTLNMVAETRALNRAIWIAIAGDVMKRVEKNLKSMDISAEDRARIMEAGRVSYEEMERPPAKSETSSSRMYEATAKRIDEISKDEEKLRRALTKIESLPLEAEQKVLIKQRIEGALRAFGGNVSHVKPKAKKKSKKK